MEPEVQFPLRCSLCHELATELELDIEADGHHNDSESLKEPPREWRSVQKNGVSFVMDQEFQETPSIPKLDTEEIKRYTDLCPKHLHNRSGFVKIHHKKASYSCQEYTLVHVHRKITEKQQQFELWERDVQTKKERYMCILK